MSNTKIVLGPNYETTRAIAITLANAYTNGRAEIDFDNKNRDVLTSLCKDTDVIITKYMNDITVNLMDFIKKGDLIIINPKNKKPFRMVKPDLIICTSNMNMVESLKTYIDSVFAISVNELKTN